MQSELTEAAKKLSIPDRILLVEEIWDTIAEENQAFELTEAQRNELDRRLDSARTNAEPRSRYWSNLGRDQSRIHEDALTAGFGSLPTQKPNSLKPANGMPTNNQIWISNSWERSTTHCR